MGHRPERLPRPSRPLCPRRTGPELSRPGQRQLQAEFRDPAEIHEHADHARRVDHEAGADEREEGGDVEHLHPEPVELTADEISVKDKIAQIVEILEAKASITFLELFSDNPNKREVIITFLAILEMVKLQLIRIIQNVQTGIIRILYV